MIHGKSICLRPLTLNDTQQILRWRQDAQLMKYFADLPLISYSELEAELYHKTRNPNRQDFIAESKEGRPLGMAYLENIDWRNKHTEMHLMLAGTAEERETNGNHAAFLLMVYAFETMNMHKLYARLMAYTQVVEKMVQVIGFQKEVLHKNFYFQEGTYQDFLVYGLLEDEFRQFLKTPKGQKCLQRFGRA